LNQINEKDQFKMQYKDIQVREENLKSMNKLEVEKLKSICGVWEQKYKDLKSQTVMDKEITEEKMKFLENQRERIQ
jgi:uncharacterized lipoprotein YehR (DUF1307 family)